MLNTATTNKKMCSKQANIAQNDVYTVFLLSFTSWKKKNAHEKSKIMKQFIYRIILSFYDKRNIIHTSKNIRICHSDYFEIFILFNNFLRLFYSEVVFFLLPPCGATDALGSEIRIKIISHLVTLKLLIYQTKCSKRYLLSCFL